MDMKNDKLARFLTSPPLLRSWVVTAVKILLPYGVLFHLKCMGILQEATIVGDGTQGWFDDKNPKPREQLWAEALEEDGMMASRAVDSTCPYRLVSSSPNRDSAGGTWWTTR